MPILVPRKVFLDTNHLIFMTKVADVDDAGRRAAYQQLVADIRSGLAIPFLGFEQPFEWVKKDDSAGYEIAQILNPAPIVYEVSYDTLAFTIEIVREAYRLSNRDAGALPFPFHRIDEPDLAQMFVVQNHPLLRRVWEARGFAAAVKTLNLGGEAHRRFSSVRKMVETAIAVRNEQPTVEQEMRQAFEIGLRVTQDNLAKERGNPRKAIVQRLARAESMTGLLRGLGFTDLEAIWQGFDLSNCPSLALWTSFWWRYASDRLRKKRESDRADVTYLPAYCYADFALTERPMASQVRQSNRSQPTWSPR